MRTVDRLLELGQARLQRPGIESPRREAALLLSQSLGMGEAALLAHGDLLVSPERGAHFEDLVARRAAGEPAAYLLGRREFWGRDFEVDDRVLIPRPETEHLVEIALELELPAGARILDLGTGSGCIAVTLAAERPGWRVTASDRSLSALAVAASNARRHGVADRVELVAADLVRGLDLAKFSLLVTNPPYVDPATRSDLAPEVARYEPASALFPPHGALDVVERILGEATPLPAGAWLACELGAGQVERALDLARAAGAWQLVEVRRDLAGIDRDALWRRRS